MSSYGSTAFRLSQQPRAFKSQPSSIPNLIGSSRCFTHSKTIRGLKLYQRSSFIWWLYGTRTGGWGVVCLCEKGHLLHALSCPPSLNATPPSARCGIQLHRRPTCPALYSKRSSHHFCLSRVISAWLLCSYAAHGHNLRNQRGRWKGRRDQASVASLFQCYFVSTADLWSWFIYHLIKSNEFKDPSNSSNPD